MEHFAYVLYVGFHAQRNLCDKQDVLFYGTPRNLINVFINRHQNISAIWSSQNFDLIEKHLSNRQHYPRYTLRSLLKKQAQAQKYPHLQSLQPSIFSCVTKLRSSSTDDQLDGLADLFCFYRPKIEKILQNNKENMATLGKNIAKGKYNDDKIEAAIPAIHPGFRLQVRITVV